MITKIGSISVVFGHEKGLAIPRGLQVNRAELGNVLHPLQKSIHFFEQDLFYKRIPPLTALNHLHKKVVLAARIVDVNDPEHQFGYCDLHNLFKPALVAAMYVERVLTGQTAAEKKIADIIFINARLGVMYYFERGENNIEHVMILAESARMRYQKYGTPNKQRQVENFIEKCKETGGFSLAETADQIFLEHMVTNLEKWKTNLSECPGLYEAFKFGFSGLMSDGHYPLLVQVFKAAEDMLKRIGMEEQAGEWRTLAEDCRAMSERVFGGG